MSSKVHIKLCADGNSRFGIGHLSRMKALASYLRKESFTVTIVLGLEPAKAFMASKTDVIKNTKYCLIDFPYSNDILFTRTRQLGIPVITFDPLWEAQADVAIRTDPRMIEIAALSDLPQTH